VAQRLLPDALHEQIRAQVFETHFLECAGLGIVRGHFRGILGHSFNSRAWLAENAESALGPADDMKLVVLLADQKEINFFAAAEFRRAIDPGMQVLKRSSRLPHCKVFGKASFFGFYQTEANRETSFHCSLFYEGDLEPGILASNP
jgi:hypothetical protein